MLSLERVKELLNDPTLSDEEIKEIRDGFHFLVEIIFEKWREDKKAGKLNGTESANTPMKCRKNRQKPQLYFNKQGS